MHSNHRHVEYRGEIVELTNSLLQLPAGGQVLLSDTTFQRIGGRLHEVKLPIFQFQKPAGGPSISIDRPRNNIDGPSYSIERPSNSIEGPRNRIEGQSRKDLEGQIKLKFEGQSKRNLDGLSKGVEGQGYEAGSNPSSRQSSIDSTSKLVVRFNTRTSGLHGIGSCTILSFIRIIIASGGLLYTQSPGVSPQRGDKMQIYQQHA